MDLIKSKRHSKILGDFGESMIMYWLSKRNFELALVDYVGIDIVAYSNVLKKRLGISVKSRTRVKGTEKDTINVNSKQIRLIHQACKYFNCTPYFGCLIDEDNENSMEIYIISLDDILRINNYKEDDKKLYIRFNDESIEKYEKLDNSFIIRSKYDEIRKNI